MSFLKRLFQRNAAQRPSLPINTTAQQVEQIIDPLVNDIFSSYHELFLLEPIVYIVYAVWGAKKDGALSFEQQEINSRVMPALALVHDILGFERATAQQLYSIDFLVRSLIISKITFMIEHLKRTLATKSDAAEPRDPDLPLPDMVSDQWLDNLKITDSESWRRRFGENDDRLY